MTSARQLPRRTRAYTTAARLRLRLYTYVIIVRGRSAGTRSSVGLHGNARRTPAAGVDPSGTLRTM